MSPSDELSWERRVSAANSALTGLAEQVVDELDVDNGGVAWWQGMTSWQHSVLLSDYLIQSLSGAAQSLELASFSAAQHREAVTAADFAIRQHWSTATKQGLEGFVPPQDAAWRKREALRQTTTEQVMYHLVQCLDRLAPATLIVGAFNCKNVSGADWGTLAAVASKPAPTKATPRSNAYEAFGPAGSAGHALQLQLVRPVLDTDAYGLPDWLTWLRESRNAAAHRAPGVGYVFPVGRPGRSPEGLHHGLPRVPKRSDVETLVRTEGRNRDLTKIVLAPSTPDVLDGLVNSTHGLALALTREMSVCWEARRDDPRVLPQPARQWQLDEPFKFLRFEGDGSPLPLALGKNPVAAVHPKVGRRLRAARIFEDDHGRNAWEREDHEER